MTNQFLVLYQEIAPPIMYVDFPNKVHFLNYVFKFSVRYSSLCSTKFMIERKAKFFDYCNNSLYIKPLTCRQHNGLNFHSDTQAWLCILLSRNNEAFLIKKKKRELGTSRIQN